MTRRIFTFFLTLLMASTLSVPAFAQTEAEQTRHKTIVSKGDQEITRRITALNASVKVIDQTAKLSASDKQTLKDEVTASITGLTSLKTKLDSDTTLADAREHAKTIVTDYRVYALVLPKVRLIKVADGQIMLEASFTELATKFTQRFTELKAAGKDTSALETTLASMSAKVLDAQTTSSAVKTKLLALQPTDYNADHAVLSGYRDQLKSAHDKLVSARQDAKTIQLGIKALAK